MSDGLTKNITMSDIRSDCLASPELFCLYKRSLQFCHVFFFFPFYKKEKEKIN